MTEKGEEYREAMVFWKKVAKHLKTMGLMRASGKPFDWETMEAIMALRGHNLTKTRDEFTMAKIVENFLSGL